MTDANDIERAMAYVDSIVWRLETLQSRSRYNVDTGELKRLPTRLRRFSNGIPQDNVSVVLEVLEKTAPYRGVVYNGEDDTENEYRPTVTMIKKDQSLVTGSDATYTIIQDLLLSNGRDYYSSGDTSSCSQYTSAEWHWDETDVEPCPEGGQGVVYQVANVQRSAENDLFSYVLRKTEAITQHMPPVVAACDEKSTVIVETWDNVYGEPGDFRWDSVRHDGSKIDIPDPCGQTQGDSVRIQYSENPDCTFKLQVETTTSKVSDGDEYMRVRDQYKAEAMDLVSHAREPLPKTGVEYADGVVTKYEVKRNDDGTYENRTTVDTERTVPSSTVSHSVMPYACRVERTDTNMAEPADGLLPGYRYGSWESTKTPGGLYVNKYMAVEHVVLDMGVTCKDTLFQHDHTIEKLASSLPDLTTFAVPPANDGKVSETHFRVDGNGSIVRTDTYSQEHSVPKSRYGVTHTPKYTITTITDTNMTARASALIGSYAYGSYRYEQTPGGRFTNEYTVYSPRYSTFASSCMHDYYKHEDVTEKTASSLTTGHIARASGGKITHVESRVDENGVAVVQTRTVQEESVPSSTVETVITPRYKTVITTDTQMSSRATALKSGKYGSYKYTITPGRLYTNEYRTYTPTYAVFGYDCAQTRYQHDHTIEETVASIPARTTDVTAARGGVIYSTQYRTDESGVYVKTGKVTKELEVKSSSVETVVTPRFTMTRQTDTNVGTAAARLSSGAKYGSYKYTVTPGGLYVNEYVTYNMENKGAYGVGRTRDAFREEHVDEEPASDISPMSGHVPDAANGVVTRVDGHVDDNGVVTKRTTVVTERAHQAANVSVQHTARGVVVRRTDRNMSGAPASALTSGYGSGLSVGSSEERTTNPGRTVDVTTVSVTPSTGSQTMESCQVTIGRHVHRRDTVLSSGTNLTPGQTQPMTATGGRVVAEEVKVGDDGIAVCERTDTKEINHEYGSRTHEDALQAYQVIERTSEPSNKGDPTYPSPNFSTTEDESSAGSAAKITSPTAMSGGSSPAKGSSTANREAHMTLSENITEGKAVSAGSFERGRQVMTDSELTDGGMFHTKEYTYIAKPQKWKDRIETDKFVSLKWTFRNLTQAQLEPLVQEVCEECAKYNFGTFTAHPEVNRTLNEFGLYDGTVGFSAASPVEGSRGSSFSSAKKEDTEIAAAPVANWWEKTMHVTPMSSLDPDVSSGTTPWFKVDVEWRHLEFGWGRGPASYKSFLSGHNSSFWADSRHSYNIDSMKFTYTLVKERKIRSYLVKGASAVPSASSSGSVVMLDNDKINNVGQSGNDGIVS